MGTKFFRRVGLNLLSISLFTISFFNYSTLAQDELNQTQKVVVLYKNDAGKQAVLHESVEVEHYFKSVPALSATLSTSDIRELEEDPNIAYIETNVKFTITGKK